MHTGENIYNRGIIVKKGVQMVSFKMDKSIREKTYKSNVCGKGVVEASDLKGNLNGHPKRHARNHSGKQNYSIVKTEEKV